MPVRESTDLRVGVRISRFAGAARGLAAEGEQQPVWQAHTYEVDPEVTARGSGHWYHAYDVELATWTTTWADSGGTRTRTLLKYELRINDARVPGPRYFSTDEERQAFIGRSFSDLTLRDLNPPQRGTVAHPLAELVG